MNKECQCGKEIYFLEDLCETCKYNTMSKLRRLIDENLTIDEISFLVGIDKIIDFNRTD